MFYHAHKIALMAILVLFTSCKDRGGGIIISNDGPTAPTVVHTNEGPFGGSIDNDNPITDPSEYLPNYNTFDIEQKIALANPGDTIVIDRDVDLNFSLYLEKPIKLKALNKTISINIRNLYAAIEMAVDNVTLEDFEINMYNTKSFVTSASNALALPTKSGLVLKGNRFVLSGNSVLLLFINNLNFANNTVFGFSNSERDIPLVEITGENVGIYANNIFDYTKKYNTGIKFNRSSSIIIKNNYVLSYSKLFNGTITFYESNNITIENNYLHDENSLRIKNNTFSEDPDNDGSIGLAFKESHNATDNGKYNFIYAIHNRMDDIGNGYVTESSGINLSMFSSVPEPKREKIFNNISSGDYTPICLIGVNNTITLAPNVNMNNYVLQNSQVLYYSGAIKPACL